MSFAPNRTAGSIPWDGVLAIARHWGGVGTLYDWLPAPDWAIERSWSPEIVRARIAYALLLHAERSMLPRLPQTQGDWMDLLEREMRRPRTTADSPGPFTDWAATTSEFGRYPSELYVERRTHESFDTPTTRTVRWLCRSILAADALVSSRLGHPGLSERWRRLVLWLLELPELQAADGVPSDHDLAACDSLGGIWLILVRGARRFAALAGQSFAEDLLALAPVLPEDDALFELGTLGLVAAAIRDAEPLAAWSTATPVAAARGARPVLTARTPSHVYELYFKVAPADCHIVEPPYLTVATPLGGRALHPDIWLSMKSVHKRVDLVIECKYSLNVSYVLDGIPQLFGYLAEYPSAVGATRIQVVIFPEELSSRAGSWQHRLAIGRPSDLTALVDAIRLGLQDVLLDRWHLAA